jgi:hypothetical protein
VRRAKWKNSRIVDQDIDMAASEFDCATPDLTGTLSIPKVQRNEVRLPARCSNFGNRPFTAFLIPAYDHHMDA